MYVGLDVHKNVCYGTVMDEKGKVAKQTKFTNDPEGVEASMESPSTVHSKPSPTTG